MDPGRLWQDTRKALLDLVFPPRCVGCGRKGAYLCEACLGQIHFVDPPLCPRCGRSFSGWGLCSFCQRHLPLIEGIRAVAYFEGGLREAIHPFKYQGLTALAPTLGKLMTTYFEDASFAVEVIIPVPLHPSRVKERGYNQALLLAQELAKETGLPLWEDSLVRATPTPPQIGLTAIRRRENVRDAFLSTDQRLAGKRVLLIDDVCTSGATLEACSVALHKPGAESVWGLVLARER